MFSGINPREKYDVKDMIEETNFCSFKIKKLHEDTILPVKAHEDDCCYDINAYLKLNNKPTELYLMSGHSYTIPCGFAVSIPKGWEIQIRPRSGLASKNEITVLNSPGTIDSGYVGEIKVILLNTGKTNFCISDGMRIAQMKISKVYDSMFEVVDELDKTERDDKGFGSTGT